MNEHNFKHEIELTEKMVREHFGNEAFQETIANCINILHKKWGHYFKKKILKSPKSWFNGDVDEKLLYFEIYIQSLYKYLSGGLLSYSKCEQESLQKIKIHMYENLSL